MIWKRQDFSGSIRESSSPQKFVHNHIFLTKPKFEISFSQNCSWCVETTHKQHGASLAAPRTVFWTLPHRRLHIFSKGEHNFEKRTLFVLRLRVYEESFGVSRKSEVPCTRSLRSFQIIPQESDVSPSPFCHSQRNQ